MTASRKIRPIKSRKRDSVFGIQRTQAFWRHVSHSWASCCIAQAHDRQTNILTKHTTMIIRINSPRLYDTSSHAFEVQITLRPTGGGVRCRWVCLAARGADHLTFIGLFISLCIAQDIDLVNWAIIWVFVFVCEYLYVGLKKRHADRLWQFLFCASRASIGSTTAVAPPALWDEMSAHSVTVSISLIRCSLQLISRHILWRLHDKSLSVESQLWQCVSSGVSIDLCTCVTFVVTFSRFLDADIPQSCFDGVGEGVKAQHLNSTVTISQCHNKVVLTEMFWTVAIIISHSKLMACVSTGFRGTSLLSQLYC